MFPDIFIDWSGFPVSNLTNIILPSVLLKNNLLWPIEKPTGFIVGLNKIYLSTSNGRLLVIDISSGEIISVLKIDSEKISKPFVQDANLFLIKDNAIIKLNWCF